MAERKLSTAARSKSAPYSIVFGFLPLLVFSHSADAERLSCRRVQLEGLKGFVEPASSSAQCHWKKCCEFECYLGGKRGQAIRPLLTVMRKSFHQASMTPYLAKLAKGPNLLYVACSCTEQRAKRGEHYDECQVHIPIRLHEQIDLPFFCLSTLVLGHHAHERRLMTGVTHETSWKVSGLFYSKRIGRNIFKYAITLRWILKVTK